jgi:hypothetical protein
MRSAFSLLPPCDPGASPPEYVSLIVKRSTWVRSVMDIPPLVIDVDCYAGHKGEQTPRVIGIGQRSVTVVQVLDQWLAPEHRYFKLRGDDGDIYLVRHDVSRGRWELTMFRRG